MPANFTFCHGRLLAGLSSSISHQLDSFYPHSPVTISPLVVRHIHKLRPSQGLTVRAADSNGSPTVVVLEGSSPDVDRQARRQADWEVARKLKASGSVYVVKVLGCNNGGLIVRFHTLVGFLPFPRLSPAHYCKESHKSIHEMARRMIDSQIAVKIVVADEENRNLVFSEREAAWDKYSKSVKVGDVFVGRVGLVEDYGAFVHLRFADGLYHLTGLVHLSEVSWDLVRDVRDVLTEGEDVRVKVSAIDWEKSRIVLSMKQLQDDPLLETLDKVIPQGGSVDAYTRGIGDDIIIEPLPGLTEIFKELLLEEGIEDVRITRQGFEKRVVSQDLQLWLSNALPIDRKFIILARAGRQVQEIQLTTTTLDQEGIKKVLQHVLERVP